MAWLVETIHDEITVPLVLRTDDPVAMESGLQAAKDQILIDATLPGVAGEEQYLALAKRYGASVALSACPEGLPTPTDERIARVSGVLLPKAFQAGLMVDDIYVDPLVTALSCDQPMVPATVETLRLLKIAAEPAPSTIVHLDDVADGAADATKPYITQAYVTMILAAGVDALVANVLDPDLMEVVRVVTQRDATSGYDRLMLRLFDVTKAEVDMDPAFADRSDPEQVNLLKTIQVLNNGLLYAESYLRA
jgi:5-methyltetrahydrofolate corrinoid/iron sulfur protein methyltransferase